MRGLQSKNSLFINPKYSKSIGCNNNNNKIGLFPAKYQRTSTGTLQMHGQWQLWSQRGNKKHVSALSISEVHTSWHVCTEYVVISFQDCWSIGSYNLRIKKKHFVLKTAVLVASRIYSNIKSSNCNVVVSYRIQNTWQMHSARPSRIDPARKVTMSSMRPRMTTRRFSQVKISSTAKWQARRPIICIIHRQKRKCKWFTIMPCSSSRPARTTWCISN